MTETTARNGHAATGEVYSLDGNWWDPLTLDRESVEAYDACDNDPQHLGETHLAAIVEAVTDAGIDAGKFPPHHPIAEAVKWHRSVAATDARTLELLAEKRAAAAHAAEKNSPDAVAARLAASMERAVVNEQFKIRSRNTAAERERQIEATRRRGDNPRALPVNLAVALAAGRPPVDWMIEGLWKRGTNVVLSGPFKRGKSAVIAEVTAALADGGRFMGKWQAKPPAGKILIVDTEQGIDEVLEVLGRANIADMDRVECLDTAGIAGDWDLTIPENMEVAVSIVREYGASVLIIDPLAPIFTAMGIDENSAAVQQPLEAFATLARRCNLDGVLVSHHSGHGGGGRARGNSAIPGWPAALWNLTVRSEDMDAQRYFDAYGRGINVPRGEMNLIGGRLSYSADFGNTIESRMSTERIETEAHRRWAMDSISAYAGNPTSWHVERLKDKGATGDVRVTVTDQAGHDHSVRITRNGLTDAIKSLETDRWIRDDAPQKNRVAWFKVPEDERPAPPVVAGESNPFLTPEEHNGDIAPDGSIVNPFAQPGSIAAGPTNS